MFSPALPASGQVSVRDANEDATAGIDGQQTSSSSESSVREPQMEQTGGAPPPPPRQSEASAAPSAAVHRRLDHLPDDVLREIFGLLLERDLCRVAQVCARFRAVADDAELWRNLYKDVFEYDLPLVHPEPNVFEFVDPEDSDSVNPWKDCFQKFYRALHVRPGYHGKTFCGRNIKYFDTVQTALTFAKNFVSNSEVSDHDAVIFVHAGTHRAEILIDSNVAVLGAAAGDVKELAILESKSNSTVKIVHGANAAYVGHLTLKLTPDRTSPIAYHEHSCLKISKYCSPTVDNCIIQSSSRYGSAVRVSGRNANPRIKYCHISDCTNRGLCVDDYGLGTYEYNQIGRNRLTGIWVKNMANPIIRGNVVFNGLEVGIIVSGKALGVFEENDVFDNHVAAFEVTEGAAPVALRNEFGSGEVGCVYIHHGGVGVFIENNITSRCSPGICILNSNPTVRCNRIYNSKVGVHIAASERSVVERNDIFGCTQAGIRIIHSNPTIRQNRIHHCKRDAILISDEAKGHIHDNEMYSNAVHGVRIETGSKPKIRCNCIHSGRIGVYFHSAGHGELLDNVIFNNEFSNVKITTGSNPFIQRNKIRGGKTGVSVSNEGFGMLEENEIFNNSEANVLIKNFSNPTFKRNKIFDGKGYGVFVFQGEGILEENQIFRNLQSGVLVCEESHPILRRNRVFYGLGVGVEIASNATATLEYNQIFNNRLGALRLASDVQPVLKENTIFNNQVAVRRDAIGP